MPDFSPENESVQGIYKLLVHSVEPRPIAFVSSTSPDGTPNLAPFSFFTVASVNPPVLAFNVMRRPGQGGGTELKDTVRNLEQTPECVVHIVPFALGERMSLASADWPYDVNEFEATGLTPVPSDLVQPPRVAESPVAFECRVEQIVRFGEGVLAGNLVLARVVRIHVDDAIWQGDNIVRDRLDPIGRLGGPFYVRTRDAVFHIPLPTPATVEQHLHQERSPA